MNARGSSWSRKSVHHHHISNLCLWGELTLLSWCAYGLTAWLSFCRSITLSSDKLQIVFHSLILSISQSQLGLIFFLFACPCLLLWVFKTKKKRKQVVSCIEENNYLLLFMDLHEYSRVICFSRWCSGCSVDEIHWKEERENHLWFARSAWVEEKKDTFVSLSLIASHALFVKTSSYRSFCYWRNTDKKR